MKIVFAGNEMGATLAQEVSRRLILIACPFSFTVDTEGDYVKEAVVTVDTPTIDDVTVLTVERICYLNNLSVFEDNKTDEYTYKNLAELELEEAASQILN